MTSPWNLPAGADTTVTSHWEAGRRERREAQRRREYLSIFSPHTSYTLHTTHCTLDTAPLESPLNHCTVKAIVKCQRPCLIVGEIVTAV